jgi:hypothetical protein
LVKPKVRMLSATWRICFLEWVRALRRWSNIDCLFFCQGEFAPD